MSIQNEAARELWETLRETEHQEDAMIRELVEMFALPERQPGWVDAKQMSELWGVTQGTAKRRLDQLVQEEKFETMKVRHEKGEMNVYRKKENSG